MLCSVDHGAFLYLSRHRSQYPGIKYWRLHRKLYGRTNLRAQIAGGGAVTEFLYVGLLATGMFAAFQLARIAGALINLWTELQTDRWERGKRSRL